MQTNHAALVLMWVSGPALSETSPTKWVPLTMRTFAIPILVLLIHPFQSFRDFYYRMLSHAVDNEVGLAVEKN